LTFISFALSLLLCAAPAWAQSARTDAQTPSASISGTIVDDTGAVIAGATVTLLDDGNSPQGTETTSHESGQFAFSNVPAGPFHIEASAPGFANQLFSGVATPGSVTNLPPIRLTLAANSVSVEVTPTLVELAEQQIKAQEQQRVFGFVPNFYVTYDPNALPLNATQKFELSWKAHLDPVQFGVVAIVAGVQQKRGDFSGFGTGAGGYAKRYGAAYASVVTRSMITQVLLPAVFRQDPRYFYKGTGSAGSRIVYAVSRTVIRKGDSGRWQPNYSGLLGGLASGALSNFYYPAADRKGVRLTLENTAIGLIGATVGRLAQEFLFKKVTSHNPGSLAPP
jgi:hypothetical protein